MILMELDFQNPALNELNLCAESGIQSIVIVGRRGVGKTYLARKYAEKVYAESFVSVLPKATDIRETVDELSEMTSNRLMCVENLDDATSGTSQILLKLFEEPVSGLYIVITCVNPAMIPNTILSRAVRVDVPDPTESDLDAYAISKDERKRDVYRRYRAYKTCKTLSDIDDVLGYNLDSIRYFDKFKKPKFLKKPLGQITWGFSHDDSNGKVDPKISLRVLLSALTPGQDYKEVLDGLIALESGRVSENAALTRMVMHLKSMGY